MNEVIESSSEEFDNADQKIRTRLGLTPILWRLAIVIGIAQFSWSIWGWQFGIFLETIVNQQQMGLTFSAGTFSSLLGFPLSGIIADRIGRKKTMVVSFIPMSLGLILLAVFPLWPFVPLFYGLATFGWSFVIIIARSVPADQIALLDGRDPARQFTMVLLPAFLVDGISPIIASILLLQGLQERYLVLLGAFGALFAAGATCKFVQETLSSTAQKKAKEGPIIPIRALGKNYWAFTISMMCFYFASGLAMPYYGNLITLEWNISTVIYGFTWSAFSLTTVLLMYTLSGVADRNIKLGLVAGLVLHVVLLGISSIGNGVELLIILNIIWAFPLVFWLGCERALTVLDVKEEIKGRAMGFFSVLMSSTGILAAPLGSYIWYSSGSLRHLFGFTFIFALMMTIPVGFNLMLTDVPKNDDG